MKRNKAGGAWVNPRDIGGYQWDAGSAFGAGTLQDHCCSCGVLFGIGVERRGKHCQHCYDTLPQLAGLRAMHRKHLVE